MLTIFSDTADDPNDLPPGIQIGLGHPTHAFAVHIADDGGYRTDPTAETPAAGRRFDFGGVPTGNPTEHLQLRPETAIELAVAFLLDGLPCTAHASDDLHQHLPDAVQGLQAPGARPVRRPASEAIDPFASFGAHGDIRREESRLRGAGIRRGVRGRRPVRPQRGWGR
ncbi:hypothetical protein ABZ436_25630 [Micromonospora matsumotoense]|uniref:hypothetical protein n=1 Tax=Micromonospora matsumotoense TaxID=121616 RepID=UPI0033CC138D